MERPPWSDVLRHGRALPTLVLSLAIGLHAIDVFVISTVMPAVVAEIGGAGFYAWATMVYMVASILGAASAAPLSTRLGARRGYVLAGLLVPRRQRRLRPQPDHAVPAPRPRRAGLRRRAAAVAVDGADRDPLPGALRTRILALVSGVWGSQRCSGRWSAASSPRSAGGAARSSSRCRSSPASPSSPGARFRSAAPPPPRPSFPGGDLGLLAGGVIMVGIASHLDRLVVQAGLLALAVIAVGLTFRLDADATNRLFPSHPVSLSRPIGIANWMSFLQSITHTAVNVFLPLTLQVVHGTPPLIAGYMIAVLALSWTLGSLIVAGLRRGAANLVLAGGQGLAALGMVGLAFGAVGLPLPAIAGFCAMVGLGIGMSNLHLTSRIMHLARPGEESLTASSIPTVRSLGIAFGAAIAGLLANAAGLDRGIGGATVAAAVTLVEGVATLAPILAFLLALRLIRVSPPEAAS